MLKRNVLNKLTPIKLLNFIEKKQQKLKKHSLFFMFNLISLFWEKNSMGYQNFMQKQKSISKITYGNLMITDIQGK
jgi:hypothetical protein